MKKTLIIIILGAAVFFGGLFTLYMLISDKIEDVRFEVQSNNEEPLVKEVDPIGQMIKLDDFVVNLADKDSRRYVRIGMTLEVKSSSAEDELKKRSAQVRDAIMVTLSDKRSEDIEGADGKEFLRRTLLARINDVLVIGKVFNLYFTDFVIQ